MALGPHLRFDFGQPPLAIEMKAFSVTQRYLLLIPS